MARTDYEFDLGLSWTGYKWDLGEHHNVYTEEELGYFTSRIPIMAHDGLSEILSVYVMDSNSFEGC